jgi:hypothetical protein
MVMVMVMMMMVTPMLRPMTRNLARATLHLHRQRWRIMALHSWLHVITVARWHGRKLANQAVMRALGNLSRLLRTSISTSTLLPARGMLDKAAGPADPGALYFLSRWK